MFSVAAFSDPGRLITRVVPRIPDIALDNMAYDINMANEWPAGICVNIGASFAHQAKQTTIFELKRPSLSQV